MIWVSELRDSFCFKVYKPPTHLQMNDTKLAFLGVG